MPAKAICLINGHPHDSSDHLCAAIADAYARGARGAGCKLKRIDLAKLDIPYLRSSADFAKPPPDAILASQAAVRAADHLVIIYPLWLGSMPALVKAFFEQLSRNQFAIAASDKGGWPRKMLKGKSARVIVTMGMPSAAYRVFFGAHGVKSFESAVLGMSGFKPIRETLIGGAGDIAEKRAKALLARMEALGAAAK